MEMKRVLISFFLCHARILDLENSYIDRKKTVLTSVYAYMFTCSCETKFKNFACEIKISGHRIVSHMKSIQLFLRDKNSHSIQYALQIFADRDLGIQMLTT